MTSIITPKPATKPKQKSVSFKIPPDLHQELEALKKRVQQHSDEVDFNLDQVMADALRKNIKAANQHLDSLYKQTSEGVDS